MAEKGRGWHGDSAGHAKAGRQGAKAQPTEAKAEGGRNSRSSGNSGNNSGGGSSS